MNPTLPARARLTGGLLALLVLLTLANGYGLAIGVLAWVDAVDHGMDWAHDAELRAAVVATLLSAVALAGLAGAWLRRRWGPRAYVAVQLLALVSLLAVGGGVTVFTLLPLVLAGVLWWIAEQSW